VFAEVCQLFNW